MPNLSKPMPRELADGVFWLGDCLEQRAKGKIYHTYNAAFLLCGTNASMLIETGHPKDFPIIEKQLKGLLATRAPLKYLFVTHQETPHSGGLGRVLARYPEAILCGDMSDYHLAFPQFADRMLPISLDLADVSAVFADRALFWTKFTDMKLYVERLQWLCDELDVKAIAPTHGLPILNVPQTMPKLQEGLLYGSSVPESGTETGLAPAKV